MAMSAESPSEISVHDNFIVSYEVDCKRREICIHTVYRDQGEPFEITDILFIGVECYYFGHDLFGRNIILDIDERVPESIYADHMNEIQAGLNYGWPGKWAASPETASEYFRQNGIRGYVLLPSYGMWGWVLAREMRLVQRHPDRMGAAPEEHV